jgi:hypothetical protein
MTGDTLRNTTIHEPPMTGGEVDMLLFALDRSRAQCAWKCCGSDAADLDADLLREAMDRLVGEEPPQ